MGTDLLDNSLYFEKYDIKFEFPSDWLVISDEIYNNQYYDKFPNKRTRIEEFDLSDQKILKSFVGISKNAINEKYMDNYITFMIMKMQSGAINNAEEQAQKLYGGMTESEIYEKVSPPEKAIIAGKTFYVINSVINSVELNYKVNRKLFIIY